jgi:arginase family enzyme
MTAEWPRKGHQVSELLLPRHYGSVPTVFGSPKTTVNDIGDADIAFLGIPWQAPVPDSRIGAAGANYFGTNLTTHTFRTNSVKYNGYLPERDIDVFAALKLVDCGDVAIDPDLKITFETVASAVEHITRAGAMPITCGGNSGPSTYAVVKGVAAAADGPVAVFNFDAHGDNHAQKMEDDDPALPPWGGTWALRTLDLPNVDPARYVHVGLRGPRNDAGTITRFIDKGVKREQIFTYEDVVRARRIGFEAWAADTLAPVADGAAKAWIVIDPDSLDLSVCPEFGDEPLGLYPEELCWSAYQIGKAAGRQRFAGVALTAIPFSAMTMHWIMMYVVLYALAGVLTSED